MGGFRFRRFWSIPAAVGVAAVLFLQAPGAPPAAAETAQQLSPGQAVRLSAPGVTLHLLSDGRLASYGVESDVAGVAFTAQAGEGADAVTAAPGAQLVVLHVVTREQRADTDATTFANGPVSLAVTSGSLSAPLQVRTDLYPSPDDGYFAAAVTAGGPAVLTLTDAGLVPQSLDLRSGRRVGAAPQVLYRAGNSPAVEVDSQAVTGFSGTAGSAGTATGQFGVATAYLSWWKPFTTTVASDPTKAFLDVEFAPTHLTLPGIDPNAIGPAGPLPAGSVTFDLPDGQVVPATVDVDPSQQVDLLSGDYYAEVPTDITSVKVSVDLPAFPIQVTSDTAPAQNLTLHLAAPLTAPVTLPPLVDYSLPPTQTPAAASPAAASAHRSGPGGGSILPVIVAVLAALVLAGLAALWWARRRAGVLPAGPVRWPPPGLPAAATLLLERGPAGALPPAGRRAADGTTEDGGDTATAPQPPDPVATWAGQPGPATPPAEAPVTVAGSPALVVRVLGPLQVEGLVAPIRRQSVRRLLVALALTPDRPLGADELAMIISDRPDRDPATTSVNSYASILRRSLPAGVLPEARTDGYRLDRAAVVVDWLAVAAVAAQPADRPGWADAADAALELVRGRSLEGGSWEGIEPVVRNMAAQVEDLAHRRAGLALGEGDGDPAAAERAVARGLAAAPTSVRLWQDRLDAAAAGSGYGLERAWSDARRCLGADAGLLAAHYQGLHRRIGTAPDSTTADRTASPDQMA